MISLRYVPAICLLGALALVPTIIHSYSARVQVDGLSAAAIPDSLAGYSSLPTTRNPTWGQRRFESDDWMERTYDNGTREVRLTVVRSYDPKSLYHHPELAVAYGTGFSGVRIEDLPERPEVPVHVLAPAPGVNAVGAYVLHYDGRFIADPIRFQIRTAGELLFSRRKAMTLFFATEQNAAPDAAFARLASAEILGAAIDAFVRGDRRAALE
jgi:hypothetical protein